MIVTDVAKIDGLVEEMMECKNCFIRVDRADYEAVKSNSASLKAVSVKAEGFDEELLSTLAAELEQAGGEDVCRVLICVGCSSVDDVSYEETMSLLRVIEQGVVGQANIVWGIGEDSSCAAGGVRVVVVLGYEK